MNECVFSPDRKYRYTLWREWDLPRIRDVELLRFGTPEFQKLRPAGDFVQFIGLNPSTANETQDDPTIRRCIRFAKDWGFGAYCMTNLFAFCTAYPKVLLENGCSVGELNDHYLAECGKEAGMIIAAWGAFPEAIERAAVVRKMFAGKLYHLGLTQGGHPRHPLYLRADTKPTLWV